MVLEFSQTCINVYNNTIFPKNATQNAGARAPAELRAVRKCRLNAAVLLGRSVAPIHVVHCRFFSHLLSPFVIDRQLIAWKKKLTRSNSKFFGAKLFSRPAPPSARPAAAAAAAAAAATSLLHRRLDTDPTGYMRIRGRLSRWRGRTCGILQVPRAPPVRTRCGTAAPAAFGPSSVSRVNAVTKSLA